MKFNIKGYIDVEITLEDTLSVALPAQSPYKAGEDILAGEAVYLDATDRAFRATAVVACGDDSNKSNVAGIAKNDAKQNEIIEILGNGSNAKCLSDGVLVIGKCVYLSTVPGRITSEMPTVNGTMRLKMGIARRPDELKINIDAPVFNSK